jgi:ComF family protein
MEPPLDAVVHAFKYGGRDDLARPLGRLLAASVPDLPAGALAAAVPLHPRRLRERGYNQALLLARAAGVRWGVPAVTGLLVRTTATRPQARLPDTRRRDNVGGAFAVPEPAPVRNRSFILVDDVVTTGSTLVESARTLYVAGAARVIPVALAMA